MELHDSLIFSLLDRGQSVGIAGQKPTAVGLLVVHSDTVPGELRCFPSAVRRHRQRVAAARVGDFTGGHYLF
jgi:hypothetical protein